LSWVNTHNVRRDIGATLQDPGNLTLTTPHIEYSGVSVEFSQSHRDNLLNIFRVDAARETIDPPLCMIFP
jgi:hypothetical protein